MSPSEADGRNRVGPALALALGMRTSPKYTLPIHSFLARLSRVLLVYSAFAWVFAARIAAVLHIFKGCQWSLDPPYTPFPAPVFLRS